MKYSSAAYRFALTRCNPPPHRKTVSIKPFKMATDGPTGRELPAWGWTGLPDPVLSTLDVDKEAVGMVDWRKCARRVKITPDTGDVSSGRAFSSAIWVNQWKCFKFISIRYWLRNRHLAKRWLITKKYRLWHVYHLSVLTKVFQRMSLYFLTTWDLV